MFKNQYVHIAAGSRMAKKTVKVRGREGTATKDISIPASVAREFNVELGDVFAVDTEHNEENQLVITYTRVYEGD